MHDGLTLNFSNGSEVCNFKTINKKQINVAVVLILRSHLTHITRGYAVYTTSYT